MNVCVIECLSDWISGWLNVCVIEFPCVIECLCDWVSVWLNVCVIEYLGDWMSGWLNVCGVCMSYWSKTLTHAQQLILQHNPIHDLSVVAVRETIMILFYESMFCKLYIIYDKPFVKRNWFFIFFLNLSTPFFYWMWRGMFVI